MELVRRMVQEAKNDTLGSVSCAIYDTAWVSMVGKEEDGEHRWYFPESFQFVLDRQLPNGAWPAYASKGDGILNSLASLLAIKRHEKAASKASGVSMEDLQARSCKAQIQIRALLEDWDIESETHVGFEILIPALLEMLREEGIEFTFQGEAALHELHDKKMKHFKPEILYGSESSTLLHSLEALIGKIDFDRVRHHKRSGSMLNSPSSSVAYLMNSSSWDTETENYLKRVVVQGSGRGCGGVPSVYPIPIFELVWVR